MSKPERDPEETGRAPSLPQPFFPSSFVFLPLDEAERKAEELLGRKQSNEGLGQRNSLTRKHYRQIA